MKKSNKILVTSGVEGIRFSFENKINVDEFGFKEYGNHTDSRYGDNADVTGNLLYGQPFTLITTKGYSIDLNISPKFVRPDSDAFITVDEARELMDDLAHDYEDVMTNMEKFGTPAEVFAISRDLFKDDLPTYGEVKRIDDNESATIQIEVLANIVFEESVTIIDVNDIHDPNYKVIEICTTHENIKSIMESFNHEDNPTPTISVWVDDGEHIVVHEVLESWSQSTDEPNNLTLMVAMSDFPF